MTSDQTTSRQPIADRTLIAAGGGFAIAAGLLRLPASLIGPDATGAAVDALYYAIDISLLFALIAAYVADPASRGRIGTLGFVIGAIGTGLLIGPEPNDSSVDYYAVGAAAIIAGLALMAIAWKHSTIFATRTRAGFLATLLVGFFASSNDAALMAAGITFSLALLDAGQTLIRATATTAGSDHTSPATHAS